MEVVELLLERDPNLALQRARVDSSRGALLAAAGRFDPELTTLLSRDDTETPLDESTSSEEEIVQTRIGLSKELRSGLTLEPSLELSRSDQPGAVASNLGTVAFTLRQPLLRDRGRAAVAAGELSAEHGLAAAELDLRHTVSERILAVVSQYWGTVAARLDLEALSASEEGSRELLATTRRLVTADVTPAADLVLLEADLAAKESARIGGERALFAARQSLGREIGLGSGEIAALPPPGEALPRLGPDQVSPLSEAPRLVELALRHRADLAAARQRQEAAGILVVAAGNAVKPRFDLVITPGYSGLVEGDGDGDFFAPLHRNVPGLSSSLALSLSWPTANRRARGELLASRAGERESALAVDLLVRSIGADVPTALDAVQRGTLQLERAVRAVELFEQAVANEEKKLRAGTSTLVDVISQKDRLTAARLNLVSAHLALALALAELRFQTGTLLATGPGEVTSVRREDLITVPYPLEAAP